MFAKLLFPKQTSTKIILMIILHFKTRPMHHQEKNYSVQKISSQATIVKHDIFKLRRRALYLRSVGWSVGILQNITKCYRILQIQISVQLLSPRSCLDRVVIFSFFYFDASNGTSVENNTQLILQRFWKEG